MNRYLRSACGAAGALALALGACTDSPTGTDGGGPQDPGGPTGPGTGAPIVISAVECTAEVASKKIECTDPTPLSGGPRAAIIVGGQNKYVTLTSSNVEYDGGTTAFTFDVTLRNLIEQPMGTTDGVALDPSGIRVFFHESPVATGGAGAITVSADGTGTFTAANQPYYQYNTVLDQFELSAPRTWQFNVPATVTSFAFKVYVSAPVEFPDGYITIQGNFNVKSGLTRQLTAKVKSAVGNVDSTAVVNWSVADPTMASISSTGLLKGLRSGVVSVQAADPSTPGRDGEAAMTVRPIRRYWTAGAGTTNWETGANWMPDSIAPTASDTAVVTDTVGTIFPSLNQNESVGGVEVFDLTPGGTVPTISLGAFNLTASGDVLTTNSSSITNSSGRLFLTGTARTVGGVLPTITVTGTYTLVSNLTLRSNTRVQAGRLRSSGFRIRSISN